MGLEVGPLQSIVCYVDDAQRTQSFYSRLGFRLVESRAGYARFNTAGMDFEFHELSFEQIEDLRREAERGPKGVGCYFYIRVNDVDRYRTQLLDSGLSIGPVSTRPWGNREFVAIDPDGYKFAFYERLSS